MAKRTRNICCIPECTGFVVGWNWCTKHYERWRKYGDPLFTKTGAGKPLAERFQSKTRPAANGCIEWTAGQVSFGYGGFHWRGKLWRAHRMAWTLAHGDIPDGLTVDHMCRNRLCVNVAHLRLLTLGENAADGKAHHHYAILGMKPGHCLAGHEMTPENTYIVPATGRRCCQTCKKANGARRYREHPELWRKTVRTHCVNGHEFTPENTLVRPKRRQCRICAEARRAA